MKSFEGGVAVITGGASGIGYGMAERFAAEGMSLVLADIDADALDAAVATLAAGGTPVIGVRTDVRELESVQALADAAIAAFGKVTILCNNAGVETGGPFLDIPARAWEWVMDVNFFGVLHGCRVFLPLLEREPAVHIVNTASTAAFASGGATMTPYCASKMAVLGLSESLEAELRASGSSVGVTVLAPGPVKTRMVEAERNLPEGIAAGSDPERIATLECLARVTAELGLEPADMLIEGLRAGSFFVLPHPEMAIAGVRKRLRWMETGEAPPPRQPGT